jgi:hypothetical protein
MGAIMITERDHLRERYAREAQRSKQLLWSVIYLAVEDATCAPVSNRPMSKSITAMRFLTSNIDVYLERLDVAPDVFRRKLLALMYNEPPTSRVTRYTEAQKRAFRFNHSWWERNKNNITDEEWELYHEQELRDL